MALMLVDILREVIDEAKQLGKLYHFTSYKKMIKIVDGGFNLKSWTMVNPHLGGGPKSKEYISFTRGKNMASMTMTTVFDEVRITVDGDKMSNKYKFEPFADTSNSYGRGNGADEMEERVVVDIKKYPGGVNISNYILSVDIKSPFSDNNDHDEDMIRPKSLIDFKDVITSLKNKNVDFKIVKSFK